MYISIKYVIFYACVGAGVGYIAEGDKKVMIAGAILSALLGSKYGESYAVLSAIEFGIGFVLGTSILSKKSEE